MTRCDRCGVGSLARIGSMFNTEMICNGCKTREVQHPAYAQARAAEEAACRSGDYNFPGVGLPADLREGPARTADRIRRMRERRSL